MKESPTEAAKRYRTLWQASSHEVSKLSNLVTMQAEEMRRARIEVEKWERRFDLLLEKR